VTSEMRSVLKSPNENVIASIATTKGEFKKENVALNVEGVAAYDTRTINNISSRVSGRLEKVYIKYIQQKVTKGQPVAEIYSPELVAAQKELLFLLQKDAGNEAVIHSAKSKLAFL